MYMLHVAMDRRTWIGPGSSGRTIAADILKRFLSPKETTSPSLPLSEEFQVSRELLFFLRCYFSVPRQGLPGGRFRNWISGDSHRFGIRNTVYLAQFEQDLWRWLSDFASLQLAEIRVRDACSTFYRAKREPSRLPGGLQVLTKRGHQLLSISSKSARCQAAEAPNSAKLSAKNRLPSWDQRVVGKQRCSECRRHRPDFRMPSVVIFRIRHQH